MSQIPRKVNVGDEFQFPAPFYNALIDGLVRQQTSQRVGGHPRIVPAPPNIIRLQNKSGYAVNRYELLGLGGALVEEPSTKPADERFITEKVMLEGQELDIDVHVGNWGMVLDRINDGDVGLAIVAGVAVTQLYVQSDDHEYCEIVLYEEAGEDGEDIIRFSTVPQSRNRILWVEPDRVENEDLAWAYIMIGSGAALPQLYEATDNASDNAINGKQVKSDGSIIGDDVEFWAMD